MSWIVIADDLAGGTSQYTLDVRAGGTSSSKHVLRLSGRLSGGALSFAGAWLTLEPSGRNLDLSAFQGVRLRLKGSGPVDVGFRSGMVNFMARVDAGPDWRVVDVPFSTLAPMGPVAAGVKWNPAVAQIFGVTTPQAPAGADRPAADFAFEIDDVMIYGTGSAAMAPVAAGPSMGLALVPFTAAASIPSAGWVDVMADPERDGQRPALPDATRLEVIPSAPGGMLWTRVTLRETPHDRWIGMNLAIDIDGDPANGAAWWGTNSSFKFDRLVTVYCFRVAAGCQGYIGLADAAQVTAGTFVAGGGDKLRFAIDRQRRAFVLGVPRDLLGAKGQEIRMVAAVGSAILYGDDVPGQGAAGIR